MSPRPDAAPRPLFVLGGHRGGTTLLQRLLNSYPDVSVWGEHEGVLTRIADAYFRGVESPMLFRDVRAARDSDPRDDWQAWMSAVTRDDWNASFRRLVTSLFLPRDADGLRFWGFKEIRYGTTPADRAIEMLGRLFPDAVVALLVRNPFNMLASACSRPEGPRSLADVEATCARLVTRFRTFRDWHASGRLRSHWIVYEELARGEGGIRRLVADLGHELGPGQREVLAAEGSARGSSFRDADVNERWRRLPAPWLAVAVDAVGPTAEELGYAVPPVSRLWRLAAPLLRRSRSGAAGR